MSDWRTGTRIFSAALMGAALISQPTAFAQDGLPPVNLRGAADGSTVRLHWNLPAAAEAVLGPGGGSVNSTDGAVSLNVPPGAFAGDTRVRVSPVPIEAFHEMVTEAGLEAAGTPLAGAGLVEVEGDFLLPLGFSAPTPPGINPRDQVFFSQFTPDALRFVSFAEFTADGGRITAEIPVNADEGLTSVGSAAAGAVEPGRRRRESSGNGVDDDGDGLIDEIEIYLYPDAPGFELCSVTGIVRYEGGAPAPGAVVRVVAGAPPVIDYADEFGRYRLPASLQGQDVSRLDFTVEAVDGMGRIGRASGSCSGRSGPTPTPVVNVVIPVSGPVAPQVAVTSPADGSTVSATPTIEGTVSDPSVTRVSVLVNGQRPPVTAAVSGGSFSVQVFLSLSVNTVVVSAANDSGAVGVAAVTLLLMDGGADPPDIVVTLQWDENTDVDLYVLTPNGNVIFFGNGNLELGQPPVDGGSLNIDRIQEETGAEVISFPFGGATAGRYGVAVQYFAGETATSAAVSVAVRGRTIGAFQSTLSQTDPWLFRDPVPANLGEVDPLSVFNVMSFDFPSGALSEPSPSADFPLTFGPLAQGLSTARRGKWARSPALLLGQTPGDFTAFNIYRAAKPGARAMGEKIATVGASVNTFDDVIAADAAAAAALGVRQTLYYQVTAVYPQGESPPSNEAAVEVGAGGPGDPCEGLPLRTYFAQFGEGLNLISSQIFVYNLSAEEASIVLLVRDDDGNPLTVDFNGQTVDGVLQSTVPGPGLRIFRTDGQGNLVQGSATICSDRTVQGGILFGGAGGLAGVGSSPPLNTGFAAPMETISALGVRTGLALMNLENAPNTLNLELQDSAGAMVATAQIVLPPLGHRAAAIDDRQNFAFSDQVDLFDFEGLLLVRGSGFAASVIQFRPGQFATFPVTPLEN